MGASQFVGRVGGLAVALGVGAAVFSAAGVASADRSAPDTRGSAGSSSDNGSSQSSAPQTGRGSSSKSPSAAATVVAQQTRSSHASAPASIDAPDSVPAPAPAAAAPLAASAVAADPAPVAAAAEAVAPESAVSDVVEDVVEPVVIAEPAPEAAPAGEVVAYSTAGSATSDGAGSDPSGPFGHPVVDLLLASFIKRETATAAPTAGANATTGLTVAPVTTYFDGVLQGNLNVTSSSGCGDLGSTCKLVYSVVDSSDGGKVKLNNVPNGLPGGAPLIQGTNGSYTFLPYATWIDAANPTKTPTPTGTQDFTVRVTESTKFDQTITSIPLIGLIAEPIIKLLQETPFLGNLLAPIIGASVAATVSVNVGTLAAGKQVAYTYFVDSFDGTRISMNYFPASTPSLVLPGQLQATIFNGPGLGSPGETNPYALLNAGGSTPPLATMRGQGLPAPFDTAPLGFNVVTWDPRGEWASGGVLQLDNPFYEGRDVSALIDWADANTPLLNEDGDPAIAMLGGSYGGGIQMTTVDPRIDTVVPAIAWNSLNESLYPTNVFKTGWANVLAAALLLPPGNSASALNRVNSQITQALLTGNLFGFISESGQAVLSSSGPTSLLTKLDIPTMYVQGIVDALFPLQQAVQNAQTQLEQNPFFAGDNADLVKMIWFCGGHGICTTQTTAQQTKQNTLIFLENLVWANFYTKEYLQQGPFAPIGQQLAQFLGATAPMQWWDQNGAPWVSLDMPWTSDFQGQPVTGGNLEGGRINSFTSRTGALTEQDPAAQIGCSITASACKWPLNQVFATEAKNAVEVLIPIPVSTDDDGNPDLFIVGAPKVSFSYSGVGNAKAVYAQVVDNATGQVLGNINTAIPVTLDGKDHTVVDFPIANIVYSNPVKGQAATSLTLQIVGNSSLYANNAVIWSVDISDVSVGLPTGDSVFKNPLAELFP